MRNLANRPHAILFKGKSRTEQAHKADCDINTIMKRALRGQSSPYVRDFDGYYGEATSTSFYEANVIVAEGNSLFAELPSHIRNRFKNDPVQFLDFIHDPKNAEEAIELGIIKAPPKKVEQTPEPKKASESKKSSDSEEKISKNPDT